jgi:hypothetical protein
MELFVVQTARRWFATTRRTACHEGRGAEPHSRGPIREDGGRGLAGSRSGHAVDMSMDPSGTKKKTDCKLQGVAG